MSVYGPTFIVKGSCFNCAHCVSESYHVQGDSGHDVRCTHPDARKQSAGHIADTSWDTPAWCPYLQGGPAKAALGSK